MGWGRESLFSDFEEAIYCSLGVSTEFFQLFRARQRYCFRNMPDIGGLTAFTTMRDRSKVGGIGFHHDSSGWCSAGRVDYSGCILEGGNTRERNQPPQLENAFCL